VVENLLLVCASGFFERREYAAALQFSVSARPAVRGVLMKKETFKNICLNALRRLTLNDTLFYYTWCAVLLKCVFFIGVMNDASHTHILFRSAVDFVVEKPAYRLIFYCAFSGLLLCFAPLFKNRARLWFLALINMLISIILILDLWYLRGFDTVPTMHLLGQGANLTNMGSSIFGMSRAIDIIFIFDALLIPGFAFFNRSVYKNVPRRKKLFAVYMGTLLLVLAVLVPFRYHLYEKSIMETVIFPYNLNGTFRNLSPVGYHLYSLYSYWKDGKAYTLSKEDTLEIRGWYGAKKEVLPGNGYSGLFKGKNLLIVQMESMEKFVVGRKINAQEITPNLNRLIGSSLYFSHIHEQVSNGNTADAELMTNTSVYPLRLGGTFFRYPFTTYLSLPVLLKRNGYSTLAVHSDGGAFWNWKVGLTSIGFDRCLDSSYFKQTECFGMGLSDSAYFDQAVPVIAAQKQPFYIFMVTLSNHTPFDIPAKFRGLHADDAIAGTKLESYLQSVHYADQCIGQLMDALRKKGMLKNTVVVFYGDHEGIHKYFSDELAALADKDAGWRDNRKETPLLIYQEGLKGKEITTIGGEIDIMPTLAYLMGIDDRELTSSVMGRNLLNTGKDYAVLSDGTFVGKGSDEDRRHALKGLEVADLIIRGDYFKAKHENDAGVPLARRKTGPDTTLR
jgi:uncharacterized sulfatase